MVQVSGNCRGKSSEQSRTRRGNDYQASLTVQEKPGERGASALRQKSLKSRFKCRWKRARAKRQTDREGNLRDRRVETGNKAGKMAQKEAGITTTQLPCAAGRLMGWHVAISHRILSSWSI